jgi:hypothetical protein
MNTQKFQRLPDISGDVAEDTALLREMARSAREYITSFAWCPPVKAMYLAYGVGGIVALFFVEFPYKIKGTDDQLWIVDGDLPSAYLVVETDDSPADALERYCGLMDEWAAAVRVGGGLNTVYPVEAEPTLENAESLEGRVAFLRAEIIPGIPS